MYNHKRLESGKARTQSPCGICKPCKIEGSRHQTLLCQMLLGDRGNTSVGQITRPTRISKTHAQQDSAQTLWYAKCSGPNHLCKTKQKQNKNTPHTQCCKHNWNTGFLSSSWIPWPWVLSAISLCTFELPSGLSSPRLIPVHRAKLSILFCLPACC